MKTTQKIAAISPDEWQTVAKPHVSHLCLFPEAIIRPDLLKGRHRSSALVTRNHIRRHKHMHASLAIAQATASGRVSLPLFQRPHDHQPLQFMSANSSHSSLFPNVLTGF